MDLVVNNRADHTTDVGRSGAANDGAIKPAIGDCTVSTKKDAKRLIKQYFEDNKDTDEADFYSIMALMIGVMEEDGFFKRTGLEKMLTAGEKEPKKPQDHKKPTKVTPK